MYAKETTKIPQLVNPGNFKETVSPKKTQWNFWNFNTILLVLSVTFFMFFLYQCKYGVFKSTETEPVPYTIL